MLQSPKPILVVDLFPEILDQLLKLLIGLESEEWNRPTVCHGWSVKDVALHLLGGEIGNLSIEPGLPGRVRYVHGQKRAAGTLKPDQAGPRSAQFVVCQDASRLPTS